MHWKYKIIYTVIQLSQSLMCMPFRVVAVRVIYTYLYNNIWLDDCKINAYKLNPINILEDSKYYVNIL